MIRAGLALSLAASASAFLPTPSLPAPSLRPAASSLTSLSCSSSPSPLNPLLSAAVAASLLLSPIAPPPAHAEDVDPAKNGPKTALQGGFKVLQGAASTQDSGSRRTITRGATLDNSQFPGQKLDGISFQQSLCRDCNFKGASLKGASFFDGDLTQADFEGADISQVNFEMACMKDANLKNAVVNEAYILATTKLDGVKIDGADFTDTFLRKDQQRYLCGRATGTNPKTGVDTYDSLQCRKVKDLKAPGSKK